MSALLYTVCLHRMAALEAEAVPLPLRPARPLPAEGASPRGLFSAARGHPTLHQLAVRLLRSITTDVTQQEQVDSVLLYLERHEQHVSSLVLTGDIQWGDPPLLILRQLPNLQLSSLQLDGFRLQLQPLGGGFQGVLASAASGVAALKQLRLKGCWLLDDGEAEEEDEEEDADDGDDDSSSSEDGPTKALSQLPVGLEHLSIRRMFTYSYNGMVQLSSGVLQQLQQLTSLELACTGALFLQNAGPLFPHNASPGMQALEALTRLVDLRLKSRCLGADDVRLTASMLSGMHLLTRLRLRGNMDYDGTEPIFMIEPGILAGKTKLLHLTLNQCLVMQQERYSCCRFCSLCSS